MTYRVGNHQPQNVYRDDQYIGVMFSPEDAALVVEALNGDLANATTRDLLSELLHRADLDDDEDGTVMLAALRPLLGLSEEVLAAQRADFLPDDLIADALNATQPYATGGIVRGPLGMTQLLMGGCVIEPVDSCTCTKAGPDPACVVHQGRRARGPKPPPLGEGCICDGSGRTCPRHGAVI